MNKIPQPVEGRFIERVVAPTNDGYMFPIVSYAFLVQLFLVVLFGCLF